MLTAAQLKALLIAHGVRLTKSLGQHHLIEPRIIARIAGSCDLTAHDTVLEIGAGLGALTEPLAQHARRIIAVEVDRKIAALLAERLGSLKNVTVVHQDVLDFPWDALRDVVVVGAIPYQIASPILVRLYEHRSRIRQAVLIMQEELAQRLVAHPGTKAYGRLSVLAQYGWEVEQLFRVPRHAFFPQPGVDSSCLRLSPWRESPVAVRNETLFFDFVKAAFAQRRKTLVNCLTATLGRRLSREAAEALVREVGLRGTVRGEALSLEQFAALANTLDAQS